MKLIHSLLIGVIALPLHAADDGPRTAQPPGAPPHKTEWHDSGDPPPFREQFKGLQRLMRKLQKENPERYHELETMRQNDPEGFRRALHGEIMKLQGSRHSEQPPGAFKKTKKDPYGKRRETFKEHLRAYREADNPEIRAEARKELKVLLEKSALEREEFQQRRLDFLEQEIRKIRKQLDASQSKRDEMIENKLQQLLDNDFPKKPPPGNKSPAG